MQIPAPHQESRGVERWPSRKTLLSDPKMNLLEENRCRGLGPACWTLGDEGQGCQGVDGKIVPQPRDKGWRRRVRKRGSQPSYWGGQMEWGVQEGDHSVVTWGKRRALFLLGDPGEEALALPCRAKDAVWYGTERILLRPPTVQKDSSPHHSSKILP